MTNKLDFIKGSPYRYFKNISREVQSFQFQNNAIERFHPGFIAVSGFHADHLLMQERPDIWEEISFQKVSVSKVQLVDTNLKQLILGREKINDSDKERLLSENADIKEASQKDQQTINAHRGQVAKLLEGLDIAPEAIEGDWVAAVCEHYALMNMSHGNELRNLNNALTNSQKETQQFKDKYANLENKVRLSAPHLTEQDDVAFAGDRH